MVFTCRRDGHVTGGPPKDSCPELGNLQLANTTSDSQKGMEIRTSVGKATEEESWSMSKPRYYLCFPDGFTVVDCLLYSRTAAVRVSCINKHEKWRGGHGIQTLNGILRRLYDQTYIVLRWRDTFTDGWLR